MLLRWTSFSGLDRVQALQFEGKTGLNGEEVDDDVVLLEFIKDPRFDSHCYQVASMVELDSLDFFSLIREKQKFHFLSLH